MKKYISIIFVALSLGFVSCSVETDEKPGGTAVQKVSGHWTVTFDQSKGEQSGTSLANATLDQLEAVNDWYARAGKVDVYTYNTVDNVSDKMWISDYSSNSSSASFWQFKVIVDVNYAASSFSCATTANTSYDGCDVTILGGKILEGAATTPRGAKADSIIAYIKFSDDDNVHSYMKMSGYRYTGFSEDK